MRSALILTVLASEFQNIEPCVAENGTTLLTTRYHSLLAAIYCPLLKSTDAMIYSHTGQVVLLICIWTPRFVSSQWKAEVWCLCYKSSILLEMLVPPLNYHFGAQAGCGSLLQTCLALRRNFQAICRYLQRIF